MRSNRATWVLSTSVCLFCIGASCGERQPSTGASDPRQGASGERAQQGQGPIVQGGGGSGGAVDPAGGMVPLPALPETDTPIAAPRPDPQIGDVAAAERALEQGFYAAVERALPALTRGAAAPRALLVRARLELETGRYDESARTAQQAARDRATRIAAETVRGEALAAKGRLDEAQRAFEAVANEPSAHRARVMLGRLLSRRGRTSEAEQVLMRLVEAYNDETITSRDGEGLAYVGMAAWALGSFQDANDAFRESTRAAPDRVETQLEWARMFLEKYDAGHAEESLRHAFERNPNSPLGHAIMARIVLEQTFDFARSEAEVARALEVNPNLVMAHVTRAGMALRDLDIAAADRHLATALAVDPNDLEALSVRAAVRFLADDADGFARAKREVLQRNPRFSRMFSIIGEYADWEHRYPEIVAMAREAVQIDARDGFAHATLGLNLLRTGDEDAGLAALRESWRYDRFNVHVYNTLNLYDDVIPQQYETFDSRPFVFRMHRQERPVLERYVPDTLRRAYEDMRRRYGFTPEGPLRIELFGNTEHFAVRTVGLPSLGVQGVCFGKVVTAISPAGGPFNWGQITWHELAHVFHIQLSRNHVPRWFTEGLAEYETIIARPEWRREEDHNLYTALVNGRLPELRMLNRAFTHARSPEDMLTAYYASSQVVAYIAERFGFAKIADMLREWGAGRTTPDVVQRALGVSIEDLDRDFRAHTMQRLAARANDFTVSFDAYTDLDPLRAAAEARPRDADAQAAYAAGLLVAGAVDQAERAARSAIAIQTKHPLGRFVLARMALGAGDARGAEEHLRALLSGGKDGYDVRLLLARVAAARDDRAGIRRELEAATRVDRERLEAWHGLAEIAEATNDADLRFRAVKAIADLDQHSREMYATLIGMLVEREAWDDVITYAERALYIDPHSADLHRILGDAYLRKGRAREALAELDVALLARPEQPGRIHVARVRALVALRRRADAERAARDATTADASLAEEARRALGGG